MSDTDTMPGNNCTDETIRSFYRKAVMAKIAVEDAAATMKSRNGFYRNILKEAKKSGVDTDAVTTAIALRLHDSDDLVVSYRNQLKMLDLAGIAPRIIDQIVDRMTAQEPTKNELHEDAMLRAFDLGSLAGRKGIDAEQASAGHYEPGTELYVEFMRGWNNGQRALAEEVFPAAREPAPRKATSRESRVVARKQAMDNAPNVSDAIARELPDDGLTPPGLPN